MNDLMPAIIGQLYPADVIARHTAAFNADTPDPAIDAWIEYGLVPDNEINLTPRQREQDSFTAGYMVGATDVIAEVRVAAASGAFGPAIIDQIAARHGAAS